MAAVVVAGFGGGGGGGDKSCPNYTILARSTTAVTAPKAPNMDAELASWG